MNFIPLEVSVVEQVGEVTCINFRSPTRSVRIDTEISNTRFVTVIVYTVGSTIYRKFSEDVGVETSNDGRTMSSTVNVK